MEARFRKDGLAAPLISFAIGGQVIAPVTKTRTLQFLQLECARSDTTWLTRDTTRCLSPFASQLRKNPCGHHSITLSTCFPPVSYLLPEWRHDYDHYLAPCPCRRRAVQLLWTEQKPGPPACNKELGCGFFSTSL